MDQHQLRARGVSPTFGGMITNPLRRLLWRLHGPYFVALLEETAELRRVVDQTRDSAAHAPAPPEPTPEGLAEARETAAKIGEAAAEARRHYDALKKDAAAIAHRLASFEEQGARIGLPPDLAPTTSVPASVDYARPSFSQCGEDRIVDYLLRICGGPPAIRYLDIGAAFPDGDNNTFLFYRQGGSGVLVEADPGYRPAYGAVRPRDQVESVALVPAPLRPENGMTELLLGENPGWTTILPERAAEAERRGKGGVRQRLMVPTMTIGTVLDRHFADGDLHLISIDAEGIDDAIVREIDFNRHRPWILVVETMGAEGPADLLARHGYASYASTYVNRIFIRQDILARAVF